LLPVISIVNNSGQRRYPRTLYIFAAMKEDSRILKGAFATVILKLLNEHKKMYGYEMTLAVKELTKGNSQIKEGTLYPSLHQLEAGGLIESTIEPFGNRQRKYYRLTANGRKKARYKFKDLFGCINNIKNLLHLKPSL
jgi:DNA-binding PadR family transcriptional regulator